MSHGKGKSAKKGNQKTFAAKRTVNPPQGGGGQPRPDDTKIPQQHDEANRLGSFERTGDHARTGNRGHQ
jgi:hypothetical protein